MGNIDGNCRHGKVDDCHKDGRSGHCRHSIHGEEAGGNVAVNVPPQVDLVPGQAEAGGDEDDDGGNTVPDDEVENCRHSVSVKHGHQCAVEEIALQN